MMSHIEDRPGGREAVEQHYRQIYNSLLATGFTGTFAMDSLVKAVVAQAINDVGLDVAWLLGLVRKIAIEAAEK